MSETPTSGQPRHEQFETMSLRVADRVATITLERPDKLNALNRELSRDVFTALGQLGETRALVFTGNDRAFSAGADLKQPPEDGWRGPIWHETWDAIAALPIPTVAAIEGYCLGGGLEFAFCCDLRIAGAAAKFGFPEVLRGILPGGGGTQRLPRLVGPARAKMMMFLGDHYDAETAERWGIINQVVPTGTALTAALALAARLAANAPLSVREIKRLVDEGASLPLSAALARERERSRWLRTTDDAAEGIQAFRDRRTPEWRGT